MALLVGVVYFLVGRLFPVPPAHVQACRLAAWGVSGVALATHIGYEHFRLRNSARFVAVHAAGAVAIGAFLLAVAGMIHSLWTTSTLRPVWFLALVLWPAFTAVPAFLVAFVTATMLSQLRPSR